MDVIRQKVLQLRGPRSRRVFVIANSNQFELLQCLPSLLFARPLHSLPFSFGDTIYQKQACALHAEAIKTASFNYVHVSNHLLNAYSKFPILSDARKLFEEIPNKDVRSWTILLSGFVRNGTHITVLEYFRRMQLESFCPNHFTLSSVCKSCSSLCNLRNGKEIHGWIFRNGIDLDAVLGNSILDLYAKCGAFDYAERVFESMEVRDTVSWNILIGGYLSNGDVERSLQLFHCLQHKDVASWNTIIDGLMRKGFERIALELLYKMVEDGLQLNSFSFVTALNLVSCLFALELGKQIHGRVMRLGIHNNGFIRNSILDMYCKCGKMENASTVFRKMPLHCCSDYSNSMAEIVSWSSIVSGYVQNADYEGALQTFSSMVREHVRVDKFTLTSIIIACANIGNLELGKQIHANIQKVGHKVDVHLASSLVDMYAKCGSLNDALIIFKQAEDQAVALWTSMIFGYALHGQGENAVELFECMLNQGIVPNEITFVGVLTACSYGGFVAKGRKYFELMQQVYGIKPGVEHYTCMANLYGRAGHLNEMKEFIDKNGISHLSAVWKSFLSACQLYKNVEMGKWVSERIQQLEPSDTGSYVLMSNMFATDHCWEKVAQVRNIMQKRKVEKFPGQSWIQLKNNHTFCAGDRSTLRYIHTWRSL